MPTLREEAVAAYLAAQEALVGEAAAALTPVLTRPGGTAMTHAEAGLVLGHTRAEVPLFVWLMEDAPTYGLCARQGSTGWTVYLVALVDDEWTRKSDPLTDLESLGAALLGASA